VTLRAGSCLRRAPPRPLWSALRLVQEGTGANAEPASYAHEGAERDVHPCFDPLEVLQRHLEVLGGLLLGPAELTADLGDASAHVLNHPLRALSLHADERRSY